MIFFNSNNPSLVNSLDSRGEENSTKQGKFGPTLYEQFISKAKVQNEGRIQNTSNSTSVLTNKNLQSNIKITNLKDSYTNRMANAISERPMIQSNASRTSDSVCSNVDLNEVRDEALDIKGMG